MQPDILKFPLPTKPKEQKLPCLRLTPQEIKYTYEIMLERGNPELTPLVLSHSYKGVITMKEDEDYLVIKIVDKDEEAGFMIKNPRISHN